MTTKMLRWWCVLVLFNALLLLQNARGEDYSDEDQRHVVAAAARGMREDFGVDFARTGAIIHRYYMKYSKIEGISSMVRLFSLTVLDEVDTRVFAYDLEKAKALSQWKAVQRQQIDSSGWIASDADSEEQQPRRRLRKRKRRPEMVPEVHTRPRRRRPVRLDEARDPWKELEAETPKRAYTRRRISPVYLPQINTANTNNAGVVSATMKFGEEQNERKMVGRRKEALNDEGAGRRRRLRTSTTSTTTNSPASVVDIKNLIKQNGGMSLSEILQKRNLSLSDLLKGKQQAISALSSNTAKQTQKYSSTKLFEDEKPEDENRFKPNRNDFSEDRLKQTESDTKEEEDQFNFPKVIRPKPVKFNEDKTIANDTSANVINNWKQEDDDDKKQEEKPVKITLDWIQPEDENIKRKPSKKLDLKQNESENPLEEIDNFRQSDQPMNDWGQNVDLVDLVQHMQTQTPKIDLPPPTNTEIIDKTILEAQKKRIGVLYKNNGRKVYTDVTKKDVVTETTDKRIFVPSHPKYYTSFNYKPDFGMEQMTKTTTLEPITTAPTKKPKLPITSAKLSNSIKKETIPPKAIRISISDILGFKPNSENETKDKEDVGPLKMLFDLEELVKTDFDSNTVIPLETTSLPFTTTKSPEVIEYTTEIIQEKMRAVSAKDEIMEILKDEDTKKHLSKILEVRNMTVDELVEQRERGSSQIHLADIFHNKTKEPEPVLEHVGEVKVMRKGKTVQQEDPKSKPLPDVSISSEELSERIPGTSFPTYKIETNKMQNPPLPIPVWKSIYPSVISKEVVSEEIPVIEEIENTISEAVNEELSNEKTNYDYDEYVQLPLGVKSAIFASLAIIGISLIVFLTILIIFKWAQRQKQRLCYPGTFKSPILQTDSRRSIRTFVSETLGRKKSLYTSRLQSMSDSWDGDKPYQ